MHKSQENLSHNKIRPISENVRYSECKGDFDMLNTLKDSPDSLGSDKMIPNYMKSVSSHIQKSSKSSLKLKKTKITDDFDQNNNTGLVCYTNSQNLQTETNNDDEDDLVETNENFHKNHTERVINYHNNKKIDHISQENVTTTTSKFAPVSLPNRINCFDLTHENNYHADKVIFYDQENSYSSKDSHTNSKLNSNFFTEKMSKKSSNNNIIIKNEEI